MKFGMESEKIIYDLKQKKVSSTAQRTLQALDDYKILYGKDDINRVTGEFVHNMIEMSSSPRTNTIEVAQDYLLSYQLVREACARTHKTLLPIASYPLQFLPTMVSQWKYYVKNCILSQNAELTWNLEPQHALFQAANCAGVHVHTEIETLPEHLALTRELMDKHNLAVALIPLIAFSSSPYFDGKHEAKSMRALRYYFGVYGKFPQFGRIPPVVKSSVELLERNRKGMRDWENIGSNLGFDAEEIHRISMKEGTNWGLVRWNRKWNTIEMRFLDTDLVGMDIAKFAVIAKAMRRSDLKGEHLQTIVLDSPSLNHALQQAKGQPEALDAILKETLPSSLVVSDADVTILPSPLMDRLIHHAIQDGLSNPLVDAYLKKIFDFSTLGMTSAEKWMITPLLKAFEEKQSTADRMLKLVGNKNVVSKTDAEELISQVMGWENEQLERLTQAFPLQLKTHPLQTVSPHPHHLN